MNSFQELNYYSETGVRYNDPRAYSITFSSNTNQTVTVNEGDSFSAPVGCNITYVQAANVDIRYEINLANATGAVASWTNLPEFLSISQPSTGVYRVNGMRTRQDWNQVRSPTIDLPTNFANNFTYSSTINDQVGNTRTFTTAVTVIAQSELSTLTPPSFTYALDTTKSIGNIAPVITDAENPGTGTYVMVISLSFSGNLAVSGSGGTVSGGINSPLTITGTRGEVNSRITTLTFTPTTGTDRDITVTYALTDTTGAITTATQYAYFEFTPSYVNNLLGPFHVASSNATLRGSITVVGRTAPSNITSVTVSENMPTVADWTTTVSGVNYVVRPAQPLANAAIYNNSYTANITANTALGFSSTSTNYTITAMTDRVSPIGKPPNDVLPNDNPGVQDPQDIWPRLTPQTIGAYKYRNVFLRFRHLTTNHPSFPLTTLELVELRGPSAAQPSSDSNGYRLFGYGYTTTPNVESWPDNAPPWNGKPNGADPQVTGNANFLAHCAYKAGITTDYGWNADGTLKSGWILICRSNQSINNTPTVINGLQQLLGPGLDGNGGFIYDPANTPIPYHDFTLSFRLSGTDTSPIYMQPMVTKVQMPLTYVTSPTNGWVYQYELGDRRQIS